MWYEVFKFELKYRSKRVDTYLFFAVLFLFSLIAFNFIFQGKNLGLVKENAPFIIARMMAITTGIFMVITSMIMGVPVLRDFEYRMESLLFINPIKKRDYLLGRFLGSFTVLIFIFSGMILGIILGEKMPWRDADQLLPFSLAPYLLPFFTLVLPSLLIGGIIFFVSGALSRKLMIVYTQGILFFVVYILSQNIENPMAAALLDPFGFRAIESLVQSWSVTERNTLSVPMKGLLLSNRIFWLIISGLTLLFGYRTFNYNVIQEKRPSKRSKKVAITPVIPVKNIILPTIAVQTGWWSKSIQLKTHALFYFQSILKEASFWSIFICAIIILIINSVNLGTAYGVDSFPATYFIVEDLQETSIFFFLIILVFYSGELIWKERHVKMDEIHDALPISNLILLAGKFIGLLLLYIFLLLILILSGITFQASSGYYNFQLDVYFVGFFLELFPFLVLYTFISFFLQIVVNSKFIGHILVLLFFLINFACTALGIGHPLLRFGGVPLGTYSEMNGYGHLLKPYLCYQSYWLAFSILLFTITVVFSIRGKETAFKKRWELSSQRWTKSLTIIGIVAATIFLGLGSTIFYNTNILNDYWSAFQKESFRAAYEKKLKTFEFIPTPQIVDVNLKVELFPKSRDYLVEGYYVLVNTEEQPLSTINVQKWISPQITLSDVMLTGGAKLDRTFEEFNYYRYELNQPILPGDSIHLNFKQKFQTEGFVAGKSNTNIVHNGTFFGSFHLPTLSYNRKFELRDDGDRKSHGLKPRSTVDLLESPLKDSAEIPTRTQQLINFEIVIGTDSNQIAIAPGKLQQQWFVADRNYFHYKMDQPIINFYSIVSADYEISKSSWTAAGSSHLHPVDLEIYYHKGHADNVHRMMEALKNSLDYFSANFSPYQYQQMRIMEFPRYGAYAQSFPNTVPFSEAIGFILDIDDEKDVDMAYFITAHELAHQWWGMQVSAADVEGRFFILESLAQYSALMVLKEKYPPEKIRQFLSREMDEYFKGRSSADKAEVPLFKVTDQEYIYYRKGALNLYALQDYISEEKVNLALSRFIEDWNSLPNSSPSTKFSKNRHANAHDLLDYFRAVTPDSLQYIISDLFETITLHQNKIIKGDYVQLSAKQYQVNYEIQAQKIQVDSLGHEHQSEINDWIDIGVYAQGAAGEVELIYLKKHKIASALTHLKILVDRPPVSIGIDPLHKLIDKNVADNILFISEVEQK